MEIKEVFEPVFKFIKSLQKKEKEIASKQAAKDRLKLVLMQDRASVSPDFFEMMKKEIIDVIKKYIEIDEEALEVELTRGLEEGLEGPALYANIPIKNVKPVAPSNEENIEQSEAMNIMTEEHAEIVAEQILTQIEEVAEESIPKEEIKEKNGDAQKNKVEKIANDKIEKKEVKKDTVKTATTKSNTVKKTTSKKTTSSKTKKEA